MINMFTDIDGNTSSRIVSLFIVIIFDLVMVAYATITQKDIPTNATTVIMAITMSCVPIALTSQVYQNTKYKEFSNREAAGEQNGERKSNGKVEEKGLYRLAEERRPHREDKKDNKAPDNQVIFNDRKEEEEEKNEDRIY